MSTTTTEDRRTEQRIRYAARQQGYTARRRKQLWYFANDRNVLQSDERGMSNPEAWSWLHEDNEGDQS